MDDQQNGRIGGTLTFFVDVVKRATRKDDRTQQNG